MKQLSILFLLVIFTLSNCKKSEYYCVEETYETLVKVHSFNDKTIELHDDLSLSISSIIVNDTRCRGWFLDNTNDCSNNCGNVLVASGYSLSIPGNTFSKNKEYLTPLDGCVSQYYEHIFEVGDEKFEVYLESVEPYPTTNDTIPDENYFALYRIIHTTETCKEKLYK